MSDLDLKLVVVMSRAIQSMHKFLEDDIKQYGITPSEFGALEYLYHNGEVSVQKIGDKILVTSGTITYTINKLLKKGFITKRQCTEDKRYSYLKLTDEGYKFIDKAFNNHKKNLNNLLKDVSDKDKEDLVNLLKKIGMTISERGEYNDHKISR